MDIVVTDGSSGSSAGDSGDRRAVGENDTLGHAGGTGGVVDGGDVLPARRHGLTPRASADSLDLGHGVDLDAILGSNGVQYLELGVAGFLTGIQGVEADDGLERGETGGEFEESRDVRQGAEYGSKLGVVHNVLGSIGSQGLVERNRE